MIHLGGVHASFLHPETPKMPVWVRDEDLDIGQPVRYVILPSPGT